MHRQHPLCTRCIGLHPVHPPTVDHGSSASVPKSYSREPNHCPCGNLQIQGPARATRFPLVTQLWLLRTCIQFSCCVKRVQIGPFARRRCGCAAIFRPCASADSRLSVRYSAASAQAVCLPCIPCIPVSAVKSASEQLAAEP